MASQERVLAKAAEAVREWIRQHYCTRCALTSKDCEEWCKVYSLRDVFPPESLARAVLEATGVKDLAQVISDLMTLAIQVAGCLEVRERQCMCPIIEWPPDGAHITPDEYCPCEWAKVMGSAKTALQRAGKEV